MSLDIHVTANCTLNLDTTEIKAAAQIFGDMTLTEFCMAVDPGNKAKSLGREWLFNKLKECKKYEEKIQRAKDAVKSVDVADALLGAQSDEPF